MQKLPDSFSMKGVSMECPEQLFLMLEELIRGEFGNIFRAKGQVKAGKQRFRFDVADGQYSVIGGEAGMETKVVFIGTEISRQSIRRYFSEKSGKIILRKRTRIL